MSESRVVRNVGWTTSWLMRLISRPSTCRNTSGALTPAGRPHHQFRGNERAVGQAQTVRCYFRHLCAGVDLDANAVELAARGLGDAFRQTRQDAVGGLDQHDANVALRIDAIEPVGDDFARGAVQLGS